MVPATPDSDRQGPESEEDQSEVQKAVKQEELIVKQEELVVKQEELVVKQVSTRATAQLNPDGFLHLQDLWEAQWDMPDYPAEYPFDPTIIRNYAWGWDFDLNAEIVLGLGSHISYIEDELDEESLKELGQGFTPGPGGEAYIHRKRMLQRIFWEVRQRWAQTLRPHLD